MDLTAFPIATAAGLLCGIISGFGIGGGSLLMVWMTAAAALDQRMAQGINLLYFIPTSAGALYFHIKNKLICWDVVIPAVICGCITAFLSAWAANVIDVTLLRKLFGAFLCFIGIKEVLTKPSDKAKPSSQH